MLYRVADKFGWTHDYILKLPKRVFLRYHGYYYMEQLMDQFMQEEDERKRKQQERQGQEQEWKELP